MKTQASKNLNFTKTNVVELNDKKIVEINGGGPYSVAPTVKEWTTPFCGQTGLIANE